ERPTLPDYLPMIGEMRGARNVFVATGHQHLGLTLGPLSGELVAQLMVRDTPAVDLAPFRIDRF
ncbi:MAG: FAD-binding oxidoreductase, partial [Paraburkholderia sp.]|nr:FAD-binding oxidoreductase [Paraburkholderia sp.]